jgi:hypothetical protein
MLVDLGRRVAVVVRHGESGDLVGGFVNAALRLTPFRRPLATATEAATGYDGGIAFVSEEGTLEVLDVATRSARSFGSVPTTGATLLLTETDGSGLAVLSAWDRNDADLDVRIFERDGSALTPTAPRHFHDDGVRVLVFPVTDAQPLALPGGAVQPGDLVVGVGRGAHPAVFLIRGDETTFLGAYPGTAWGDERLVLGWEDYAWVDAVQQTGVPRRTYRQVRPEALEVAGLGSIASAGGRRIEAFGGTLVVNTAHRPGEVGLYAIAD